MASRYTMVRKFISLTAAVLPLGLALSASAQAVPARPLDPATAIIEAFKTHEVVALDEGNHGNVQGAEFREALYRDARFQKVVNDIVVEFGNSRYQATMDRYIAGEDVPDKEVRMAWLETSAPNAVWDLTIYADMFRTIRQINLNLPKAHRLRVLLGDMPYTYDPAAPGRRATRDDAFTADLIQREVIAKGRKALIVYGGMHLLRKTMPTPVMPPGAPPRPESYSIVTLLEKAGVKVFSIWTFVPILGGDLSALQADVETWPKPSLALIKDTVLGVAPFTFYYPRGSGRTMRPGPNGPVVTDLGEAIGGVMQEQVDALLYVGPKSEITYAKLPAALCEDPAYIEMRGRRMNPQMWADDATAAASTFLARCRTAAQGK